MRLLPQSKATLGVIALVAMTLFFTFAAQSGPKENATGQEPGMVALDAPLNSGRLALDDVDFDGLLAVVDPDAVKKSETPPEPDKPRAPGPLGALRRASKAGDWRAAVAALRNLAGNREERPQDTGDAKSQKSIVEIGRALLAHVKQIPHRPIERDIVLAIAGFLLLPFAWRRVRGSGDVTVYIDYPGELRGTFRVRLSRHKIL